MLSKADPSRSLIKLNIIPEEKLNDTYSVRKITLLQVEKE